MPLSQTQIIFSFILFIPAISSFVTVDQLSLEMEPSMEDFNAYLKDFIGSSKELTLLLDYDGV